MKGALLVYPTLLFSLIIVGCGQVVAVRHTMLPPAAIGPLEPKDVSGVHLVKQGVRPQEGCVRLAKLSAKGDPYTKTENLEEKLKMEGAKLGADFVLVTGYREIEDNDTPHFVEYGAGIPIADDVMNPYLYGLACRTSKVHIGAQLSKDWTVKSVTAGSVADKIGIKEGDLLVGVNGHNLPDHEYAYDQNVLARHPGDRVTIEYLTKDGARHAQTVTLE